MTIAEKIKQSFEGATGLRLLYATNEEINRAISYARMPCGFFTLLSSGEVVNYSSGASERVEVTLAVITLADGEPASYSNEERIELCKVEVLKWLKSLRTSDTLRVTDEFRTQRVYDEFDDVVTGFSVTLTLEDLVPQCGDDPHEPYQVKEVEPKGFEQTILPDDGYLALSKVVVGAVTAEVDPNIKPENIVKDVTILGVEGIAESVDTRPTEAFYNYDLAAYAQKYFSKDYPNVIVYMLKYVNAKQATKDFYVPYDCARVVLNSVEMFDVAEGTPFEITSQPTILMCCFDNEHNHQRILTPFDGENIGNNGQLQKVYTSGIGVGGLGWSKYIGRPVSSSTGNLRSFIITNTPEPWSMDYRDANTYGYTGNGLMELVLEGLTSVNAPTTFTMYYIQFASLPDITNITLRARSDQLIATANSYFVGDFNRVMPNLVYMCGLGYRFTSWATTEATGAPYTLHHNKLEHFDTATMFTGYSLMTGSQPTLATMEDWSWYRIDLPSCSYFYCTNLYNGATVKTYMRSIRVGRLTYLNYDTSTTRNYYLEYFEVGEGTDIDLNLAGFGAMYATQPTLVADVEAECLQVIGNIRRGLLDKVADHTGEVDVRSITISAINTFLDSPYMSVVDATVELLADFADKGWSLGG